MRPAEIALATTRFAAHSSPLVPAAIMFVLVVLPNLIVVAVTIRARNREPLPERK